MVVIQNTSNSNNQCKKKLHVYAPFPLNTTRENRMGVHL